MKMGNIVSPWRYDAGACCTLQSTKLRWTTIWHFAFAAAHPQYLDPLARDCADRVVPISVAPQLCHALGVPPGQTGAVASSGQPIGASEALRAVSMGRAGLHLAAT